MSASIVRKGYVSVKGDCLFSLTWSKQWLVLSEQNLTFYQEETSTQSTVSISLNEVNAISRTDMRPYCFELVIKDKSYYISCENDDELYSWIDDIYQRLPLIGISKPINFIHEVHVTFDADRGEFTVS
jgi:hypothetical protein